MLRFRALIAIWLLILSLFNMPPAPTVAQGAADYAIANGHFFTQTAGGYSGYSVVDDGEARFWSEFNRLGGLQNVGYPISQRFLYDGFVTQAFQKLVLQWRPEVGQAWPVNVFDELSENGFDERLYRVRQTPYPLQNFDPPGASWEQIVHIRQALLDANPAIRARYFAAADPLNVYGLPVSRVEDMGNHYAVRTQRAVFQQWKEDVPWASQGQVTIANGGDIAKELGWLSIDVLQPERGVEEPWRVAKVLVGAGAPGPLWAWQLRNTPTGAEHRLLISGNYGEQWEPFAGGLPVESSCLHSVDLDYATANSLYASTCRGIYRWDGGAWQPISTQAASAVVVAYRNPTELWVIANTSPGGPILHSRDGGTSWQGASTGLIHFRGMATLAIDARDNNPLYGITLPNYAGSYLRRGDPASGSWATLPTPENNAAIDTEMVIDGRTGNLYVTAQLSAKLWRSTNPDTPNVDDVQWEMVHDFGPQRRASLLAAGWSPHGLALYANLSPLHPADEGAYIVDNPVLHRSTDGGHTWEALWMP